MSVYLFWPTNCSVASCATFRRGSGPLCFCQVYLMTWLFCFAGAQSDGGFEEHFDSIWLSPAASHSLPCRGPQKGRYAQLSGPRKLFPPLRREDYTQFAAGRKQHAAPQSALWATLISVLQPEDGSKHTPANTQHAGTDVVWVNEPWTCTRHFTVLRYRSPVRRDASC